MGDDSGVLVAVALLAAPVLAAVILWGDWTLVVAAAAIAAIEVALLQRTQRFGARVWRSLGVGRRARRERGAEQAYVVAAMAGVGLLLWAVVGGATRALS